MTFLLNPNLRRRSNETGDDGGGDRHWAMSESHGPQRRPASQARVELDPESEVPIALAQVDTDDKGLGVVTTTRSEASSTSGESSQAGTLSRVDSKTTGSGTSRRTSIAASEETMEPHGEANGVARVDSKS